MLAPEEGALVRLHDGVAVLNRDYKRLRKFVDGLTIADPDLDRRRAGRRARSAVEAASTDPA